jgi:membrane-associated phospholipid phosphatase
VTNPLDQPILSAVNSIAGQSYLFDHSITFIAASDLLKGVPFICLLWSYWFRAGTPASIRRTRDHVACTIVAGVVAIVLGRILALSLPFRVRPRYNPEVHFHIPPSWDQPDLIDWSSFPSDHAVLFSALATGLMFISRRVGIGALAYVALIIGLPRVYLGYHYPTDVLVGMLLGVAIGYTFNVGAAYEAQTRIWQRCETAAPAIFYPGLFAVSEQVATLFGEVRRAALMLINGIRHFW